MGNYNPSVPIILGQEWVPIRDEDQTFAPSVNDTEVGHGFTLLTAKQVRDARFYVRELPANPASRQTAQFGIYPTGTEDLTGPIRQVLIPVSFGAVTGSNISASGSNVASALAKPGDFLSVTANFNSLTAQELSMFFDVNRYIELANKRILNVSLLYTGYVQQFNSTTGMYEPFVDADPVLTPLTAFKITNDAISQSQTYETQFVSNTGSLKLNTAINPTTGDPFADQEIQVLNLGDVNPFWSVALGPNGTNDRMPWRFVDLQRYETGAANRLHAHVTFQIPSSSVAAVLEYVAMRVIYCEEQRVAYGARQFTYAQPAMQSITLRDLSHNTDPILPADEYTLTLSTVNPGDISFGQGVSTAFPDLNAVRELYDIPPHPGVQVNIPFPAAEHIGDTFTVEQTHILPHLSLHASGGTLTEPHVYGRQAAAQVWGTRTATQELYDDLVGVNTVYPQVRYIARRYGDDSGTLTLAGTGSLSGSTATITSAEFDELPEIIDGWAEITLRFATPPTMGTLASPEPSWTWSAATATAGNRWEILAAVAPAISGIPGNLYNLVPTPNQLYAATYQPPAGSTVELTWMPQGIASTWVTGATTDQATDAFLIFSTDPPTVTGVAVTTTSQIVSGIGLDCGGVPCCIPTGIGYNRLTWSPTSLPVSGFGSFELQRWDSVTDWQTIMSASSPYVTGFNDFEARVGLDSVYRIRATNLYDFAGAWSTQVTGTVTSPGVAGCNVDGGVLIFTTNEDQTGASNLAYSPGWEQSGGEETFDFPEADQVVFQRMYGRDGPVAFHGTERGLEHFVRLLVIQQAAISPIRLANLRTLRDLAWADLPYVCVRDDIGDRWFANVRVPGERVHQRALYMATVDITEVTQTANPTDPAG